MIIRIDHVSLAVKDYEGALEFFTKIFGATSQFNGTDNALKYYWETLALGDLSRLELIKSTGEGSFLENFFKNKDGGIHHLVLQTPSIELAKKLLEENGIPYFGFRISEYWKELFIHPKDAFGVLLQIAEFRPEDWLDPSYGMPEGKKWEVSKNEGDYCIIFGHPGGGKVKINLVQEEVNQLIHDLTKVVE